MIFRRLALCLAFLFAAGAVRASSDDLLPGSVPFTDHLLWGKAVKFGFDDSGTYTGPTRWYASDGSNDCHATIYQQRNYANGYIDVAADGDAHRSFNALSKTKEMAGPAAANGLKLSTGKVFLDTVVTLDAYTEPFERTDSRDKLNCWLYVKEDGSVTNFMITAGAIVSTNAVVATNYVVDAASFVPGTEVRLVVKAVGDAFTTNCPGLIGFEVYADGVQLTSGGKGVFPSAVSPTADDGAYLHSLGLTGPSTASRINFTHMDPIEDPDYYKSDVSMLLESAVITVAEFPGAAGALVDFPMLVRVSEENIKGFYYSRCSYGGLDIRFTDENGQLIPHEIESWNPGGESIFWVKVPYFRRYATVTMHWSLAGGTSAPENNPYEVWSEYVGVWHFATNKTGVVSLEDSSGNGYDITTVGDPLESVESKIGTAGYAVASTNFVSKDFSTQYSELAEAFTFTGWYKWQNGDRYQSTTKIAGKTDANVYGAKMRGWTMATPKETKARFYADGCSQSQGADTPEAFSGLKSEWGHVGLVYDGGVATAYANACAGTPTNLVVSLVTNLMQTMTAGIAADELRITTKVRSPEWIAAECMQATNVSFLTYGVGNVKDSENYWVVEPTCSVHPPAVSVEDASTLVFTIGVPRYGTPFQKFYDIGGTELTHQPTAIGTYKCVTIVEEGVHAGLRHEIAFVIFEKRSYRNLTGHDRAMLFNSDISAAAPVELQGYYDVDSDEVELWYHGSDDEDEDPYYYEYRWEKDDYPFVSDGVNHWYYQPNTAQSKLLWQFRDCRIGNLYLAPEDYEEEDEEEEDEGGEDAGEPCMEDEYNYLPWGGAGARRYRDSEKAADDARYAGQLLLRNFSLKTVEDPETEDGQVAAAYSPVYTNGIGTIYFDAVNVCCECINELKVQYCTFYDPSEPWYATSTDPWKDLPLDVFAITGGAYDESLSTSGVTTASLAMSQGATYDCFYRIRATVNIQTNVRFRIVRCDDSSNMNIDDRDDPVGLIAVDNILVSPPGMGVEISQYGAPADKDNLVLRGQRAPFDVAFPTAKDLGSVHAQVKVDYIVNSTNEIDTSFIGAITFRYRWRYLEQIVNEWRELTLLVDPTDPQRWVSTEPLVGYGNGDIEYEATAIVNAPFYVYYDYSGLADWVWPDGYSERRGNCTIDAENDGVYSTGNLSPALGTDYFVRLRDGASEYEGIRVIIRRTDKDTPEEVPETDEEVLELETTSDHNWRGFYLVETNGLDHAFYRVEAYNRQTEVGVDYQWNTNYLHGADQDSFPASDVWESGETNVWTRIPCDELTGRIMFQVDDESWAVSIIRAEYQNFNDWTDATLPAGRFHGVSQEGSTSGVSRVAKTFSCDFKGFQESVATDDAWNESFDVDEVSEEGGFPIGKTFKRDQKTPNGWTANDGQWVCERYRVLGGTSQALSLNAGGFGDLTFHKQYLPRGVESVTYYARTSQTYDDRPFSYYNCATNELMELPGLTFAVPCAMRVTDADSEFHGVGTVSLVARYRDGIGGYEARADRVASNTVELSIYKWTGNTATLIGTSPVVIAYTGETDRSSNMGTTGTTEARRLFGALAISVTNTPLGVKVSAGIMVKRGQKVSASASLNEKEFYWMSWEDTDSPLYSGTVGIGSKGCPAVFARPVYSTKPFIPSGNVQTSGSIKYWAEPEQLKLANERLLLNTEEDYDNWNIYETRHRRKELKESPRNLPGIKAVPLSQVVYLEGSLNGTDDYVMFASNVVSSFGFEKVENVFRQCGSYLFRLTVGGEDRGGTAVVFDDISVRQWQGEDYDDTDNPDRLLFSNLTRGAPTNFVYTTSWVKEDDGPMELAPLRTTATLPMSIRAPLFDGDKTTKRGLGLGSLSFRYVNADSHARLLVQVWTNSVDVTSLKDETTRLVGDWETVETISFDGKSEDELAGGLISTYVGIHGVKGVMRLLVDPTVVVEANDTTQNPGRDPSYGRIYITMIAVKDNPSLNSGSWWGWNLRTTEEGNRQLLKDGDLDPRLHGLSYALNNSVTANTIEGDIYTTHKPFLQTPILKEGAIGEISFKARKYSAGDPSPSVAIYAMEGSNPSARDREFTFLTNIVVTCDRYERFTFMAPANRNYTAFRLAVTGVEGVEGDGGPDGAGPMPASGYVRRVMIDEVSVFEALRARLGFRKVGAFRSMLSESGAVPGVPCQSEQPICNESWGIQAEIYAIRLSEKVDYDRTPRVFLHWVQNLNNLWGYERWKNNSAAHTVELKPAEAGSLVYRSNLLTCPDAVMPSVSKGNTTFQYMLEVVYYMQDQSEATTNLLESTEWSTPDWYRPIDYNADPKKGKGEYFAAYTIIDSVPSGWAWINEANLFGKVDTSTGVNSDAANQYLEVAAPIEADLTGWSLRLLTPQTGSETRPVLTNTLATFGYTEYKGRTLKGTKDVKYAASNMVFLCVGSPKTYDAGKLTYEAGTLDGAWPTPGSTSGYLKYDGEIEFMKGLGLQLVRPSGIVEHELVAIGTNYYKAGGAYSGKQYMPTNVVRFLNEKMPGSEFFYAGADEGGRGNSLGVFDSFGESSNYWNNTMIETPGRINQFQFINPDHPVPIGSFVTVYFNLFGDHVYQTVGEGVRTNVSQVCIVRKGSAVGTNVVYDIDKWYELAEVSSSDGATVWSYSPNVRKATVAAAVNSEQNSITVTARAQVSKTLRDLGCDENNKYTPAIIDWLEKQKFLKDVYGLGSDDWPDSDGQIYLADFMGLNRQIVGQMTLTQMYWLDVCPTISNQCLIAGMATPPSEKIVGYETYEGTVSVTNRKMSVKMMFTNTVENAVSPYYGAAWAPYVLRGITPGYHSQAFGPTSKSWTNETFKITGILANGFTREDNEDNWVPQRYFVFNDNSFSNFLSTVEVPDPHSSRSLGYEFGWGDWWRQHPDDRSPVFFSWSIDERCAPVSVEVLKANESE